MSRKVSFRLVAFFCVVTLSFGLENYAIADCTQSQCQYLPFVARVQPVQIESYNSGTTGRSRLFKFIGSLVNSASYSVRDVTLAAVLLDTSSGQTKTVTTQTILPATLPGQLNPFSFTSSFPVIGFYIRPTAPSILSWKTLNGIQYGNPTIESRLILAEPYTITNQYPKTYVYGTLRNNTGTNLKDVQVVAWSTAKLQLEMQPSIPFLGMGQTAPYSITLYNTSDPISPTLQLVAQGVVVP